MGFLNVNSKRKRPVKRDAARKSKQPRPRVRPHAGVGRGERTASPSPSPLPPPLLRRAAPGSGLAPIERLPVELLEHIFRLSANLRLPQASRELAQKLRRSPAREIALLRAQMAVPQNAMPTRVLDWPFVTAKLLLHLEVREFLSETGSRVPVAPQWLEARALASEDQSEGLAMAAFLAQCGCHFRDSISVYKKFQQFALYKAVGAMARDAQLADAEVVMTTIKAGQDVSLAVRLYHCTRYELNFGQYWAIDSLLREQGLQDFIPQFPIPSSAV